MRVVHKAYSGARVQAKFKNMIRDTCGRHMLGQVTSYMLKHVPEKDMLQNVPGRALRQVPKH